MLRPAPLCISRLSTFSYRVASFSFHPPTQPWGNTARHRFALLLSLHKHRFASHLTSATSASKKREARLGSFLLLLVQRQPSRAGLLPHTSTRLAPLNVLTLSADQCLTAHHSVEQHPHRSGSYIVLDCHVFSRFDGFFVRHKHLKLVSKHWSLRKFCKTKQNRTNELGCHDILNGL